MDEYESLSHSKWECKYHVVFIPKCRRKTLYGELRRTLSPSSCVSRSTSRIFLIDILILAIGRPCCS
jgi:REP element-mobilizing transposase RayT